MEDYIVIKGNKKEPYECFLLQFDGKSEPNPGPSSSGIVLFGPVVEKSGNYFRKKLLESGCYITHATNNQAEYDGLLLGLTKAFLLNIRNLVIEGDSNLIINQVCNKWQVKDSRLKVLYDKVTTLLELFDYVAIKHVYRDKNKLADKITNIVHELKHDYEKEYK